MPLSGRTLYGAGRAGIVRTETIHFFAQDSGGVEWLSYQLVHNIVTNWPSEVANCPVAKSESL